MRAYRASSSLKAGEYAFNPGMSMFEVMDTIRSGKGVVYKVTLPEGLTVHQIFQRLAENEVLTGDLPAELPPEGSLLPDTYPFQRGAKRADVVAQMRRAHDKLLAEVWARRTEGLPVNAGGTGDTRVDCREGNRQGR
ncbi:MAG: endolytic transglycosylase MltG [Nitratireductor sp.]